MAPDDEEEEFQLNMALAQSLSLSESHSRGFKEVDSSMSASEIAFFTDAPVHPSSLSGFRAQPKETSEMPPASKASSAQSASLKDSASSGRWFGLLSSKKPDDMKSNPRPSAVCKKCGEECVQGRVVRSGVDVYHPQCFLCATCSQPIEAAAVTRGGSLYHAACAQPLSTSTRCGFCLKSIGAGRHVVHRGEKFHSECFRCAGCQQPIQAAFALKGEPELPYHPDCAKTLFNPRCVQCGAVLEGSHLRHPYFVDEVYCSSHQEAEICFACGRRARVGAPLTDIPDGRSLCCSCVATVIMDSGEAAMLFREVLHFMRNTLDLAVPADMQDVPVLAVDVHSLNEHQSEAVSVHNSSVVRGCTLSSQTTVRHFDRHGWVAGGSFTTRSSREVTAILVLHGLPRDLAGSVIAHEAMHAFIKLSPARFPRDLPCALEEGLCQWVAYRYLEALSSAAASEQDWDPEQDRLRGYFRQQIADDPTPTYGDSFRTALAAERVLSWEVLLDHVADHLSFPVV